MPGRILTEDDRDDEGLDVLCAGFVCVSRKIGNVEAQGRVVAQDSVEICKQVLIRREQETSWYRTPLTTKESPREDRTADSGALCNDRALTDGAARLVQCVTENG